MSIKQSIIIGLSLITALVSGVAASGPGSKCPPQDALCTRDNMTFPPDSTVAYVSRCWSNNNGAWNCNTPADSECAENEVDILKCKYEYPEVSCPQVGEWCQFRSMSLPSKGRVTANCWFKDNKTKLWNCDMLETCPANRGMIDIRGCPNLK